MAQKQASYLKSIPKYNDMLRFNMRTLVELIQQLPTRSMVKLKYIGDQKQFLLA